MGGPRSEIAGIGRLNPGGPGPGILLRYYGKLLKFHGPQGWWPGDSLFEVVLGAMLVQNTSWSNVERTLDGLRKRGLLSPAELRKQSLARLTQLLRQSGTFRRKALLVRRFLDFLFEDHGGSLEKMFRLPARQLRADLLRITGIGPETADSILLYAGDKPSFVIGEYTRRVAARHELAEHGESYDRLQALFEDRLPRDALLYKEYHALLVAVGKQFCHRRTPDCAACPLRDELPRRRRPRA